MTHDELANICDAVAEVLDEELHPIVSRIEALEKLAKVEPPVPDCDEKTVAAAVRAQLEAISP